jgi:hypothetical protein
MPPYVEVCLVLRSDLDRSLGDGLQSDQSCQMLAQSEGAEARAAVVACGASQSTVQVAAQPLLARDAESQGALVDVAAEVLCWRCESGSFSKTALTRWADLFCDFPPFALLSWALGPASCVENRLSSTRRTLLYSVIA